MERREFLTSLSLAAPATLFTGHALLGATSPKKEKLKMEPQSGYNGNTGSMSDRTVIHVPIKSRQARQLDEDRLAILHNTSLIAPGEDGLRDIRVMEAIYKSVAAGSIVRI